MQDDEFKALVERLRTTRLLSQRMQYALQEEAATALETLAREKAELKKDAETAQQMGRYLIAATEAERDEARAQLTATQARLEEAKSEAWERAHKVKAPEDAEILALCERIGFGAVMDSASRQWILRDPIGAFYIGGCLAKQENPNG